MVKIKAYGISLHSKFLEIQCSQDRLIEGNTISISNHECSRLTDRGVLEYANHTYKIVSVNRNSSDQYSINVILKS